MINEDLILRLSSDIRDPGKVTEATNEIMKLQNSHPREMLAAASRFLLSDENEKSAFMAALIINNTLRPIQYLTLVKTNNDLWSNLSPEIKSMIKQGTFRGLTYSDEYIRNSCAKSVSLIARLDVPTENYPDLFDNIFKIIYDDQYGPWAKLGGLSALAELFLVNTSFDSIIPDKSKIPEIGHNIFRITITILQSNTTDKFKETAANTLRAVLPFFHDYITEQFDSLLDVIISILPIKSSAYLLLTKFVKIYYNNIFPGPFGKIFDAVALDINSGDTASQMYAIDFWRKISKFEYKISHSIQKDRVFHNISKHLCTSLDKPLLNLVILKIDEDDLPFLIKDCLKQFSIIQENFEIVVNDCVSFFQNYIAEDNWKSQYAAILSLFAFVSIEGETSISEFFTSLTPKLVGEFCNAQCINVRCLVIELAGEILFHNFQAFVQNDYLKNILNISIQLLQQHPQTSAAACGTLSRVFEKLSDLSGPINLEIFDQVGPILISLMDRLEFFNDELYNQCCNALKKMVKMLPTNINGNNIDDQFLNFFILVGMRLEKAISANFPSIDCQHKMINILCHLITLTTQKFTYHNISLDQLMAQTTAKILDMLFYLVTAKNGLNDEDAITTIASLILNGHREVITSQITKIIQMFTSLYLNSPSQSIKCYSAKTIGDIYHIYPQFIVGLSQQLMETTFEYLFHRNDILPNYTTQILHVVGDIINNNDVSNGEYLEQVLRALNYFKNITVPKNDIETAKYLIGSLLFVSGRVIKKYCDIELIKKKKSLLYFGVLQLYKKGYYSDIALQGEFVLFLEEILGMQRDIIRIFSNFLRRGETLETLTYLKNASLYKNKAWKLEKMIYKFT